MITTAWKVVSDSRDGAIISTAPGTYKRGAVVRAHPRSLGIFCFSELDDAIEFASNHQTDRRSLMIVRVQGFGKGVKNPNIIALGTIVWETAEKIVEAWIEDLTSFGMRYRTRPSIPGTVCFKAIKVLE